MKRLQLFLALCLGLFLTTQLSAQIATPQGSQLATTGQTVGISTVDITYSRPSVRNREIWGTQLAHYGFQNLNFGTSKAAPWRAGANENTTITFSHDATVEGKAIPAGTYGLHIALSEGDKATVIFSKNATSWGSYFYDQKEDALRVDVKTNTIPHKELLTYQFIAVDATTATAALQWEKKEIPFKIGFAVNDLILADARLKMRDQAGFNRQTWEQAAGFALANNGDMNEALGWINNAIAGQFYSQKTFANTQIKSSILAKMGKKEEAMTVMNDVMDMATVLEMHQYGRQLIGMGENDKALEVFTSNAKKHKDVWPTHYGMARAYSAKGDFKNAVKHIKVALENAPNPASKGRVQANMDKLQKGVDIN